MSSIGAAMLVAWLALTAACGAPPPAPAPEDPEAAVTVLRVVDGDTIQVRLAGQDVTVRYIGMNTPESVDPRRPVERFGREAAGRNRALVQGKTVRLERDVSETDRFGRLLRYVWLEGELVNETLVREGLARAVSYPPDIKHQERLRAAERAARAANRGLWGTE